MAEKRTVCCRGQPGSDAGRKMEFGPSSSRGGRGGISRLQLLQLPTLGALAFHLLLRLEVAKMDPYQ